ncbi:hypothetical protein [Paractinoplanes durhamensis]|nr:hypothetical protein [Actinoplanes durhamensis]
MAMLAHGERVVFYGDSPFYTDRLNFPDGVNLMANTSVLAISLPLAPVTHEFGPAVSFAVMLTVALAGTAGAWWWLLSRHLVESRVAAFAGGLWIGFAPGFVLHTNGQPNLACGFVVPFIVWQVIRLREPGRRWRGGALLGVLIAVQAFVGEEFLLLLAITLGFVAFFFAFSRPPVRDFLAGLLVAAGVAGVLLAYPLYWQFFGPGHYSGLPFRPDLYATPLGSIVAYPRGVLAGNDAIAKRVGGGSLTEDATLWGPGACLMLLVSMALLWRSVAARSVALAGLVLLVMSFGSRLRITKATSIGPAPLGWLDRLPVFDLVSTSRYALATTTIVGVLFALAGDRVRRCSRLWRGAFWGGMAVAMVPLFPLPLHTRPAPPTPAFFADGNWRSYVPDGRSVVIVPLPAMVTGRDGMRIAALNHLDFPVPRGYFLGPKDPPRDNSGSWSPPARYTVLLLDGIRRTGRVPVLIGGERQAVLSDLRYWRAAIVVLLPAAPHRAAVRRVLISVLGPPSAVGGVELWRVPAEA